jgi:hypothetical protein
MAASLCTVALASDSATPPQAAATASADRDSYIRKASDDLQIWQKKLQEFGDKTEIQGQEAGRKAKADLNKAWRQTQDDYRTLKAAGAADWSAAKISFENSSRDLAALWDKNTSTGK